MHSLFEESEIAKFSKSELREYEDSLKAHRDLTNSLNTAEEKGRAEGRAEERVKVVKNLSAFGLSVEQIAETEHLTVEEINGILSSSYN